MTEDGVPTAFTHDAKRAGVLDMVRSVLIILGCVATLAGTAPADPLGAGWQVQNGEWSTADDSPLVVRQSSASGPAAAAPPSFIAPGNVWRCAVEPAPGAESAGFYFGASPTFKQGYVLMLGGVSGRGVALSDASGAVLWQDRYRLSTYYTPVVLEAVIEPGRIRVQAFQWDRTTLLAQSDWIPVQDVGPEERGGFALFTYNGAARFWGWERADQPLSDIVPDSPSRLRLASDPAQEWIIVGNGDWRWTTPEAEALKQAAVVERTMALRSEPVDPEGVWRTKVSVGEGAGGAGLLLLTDEKVQRGFVVWLGGEFGNGGLMLYRLPDQTLWSSDQGKWHYGAEYLIEGIVEAGKVRVRMRTADGLALIAESPAFDLTDDEKTRPGLLGLETWKGSATFWDFAVEARPPVEDLPVLAASELGPGWRVFNGSWHWADPEHRVVWQVAEKGLCTALNVEAAADKGVYSGRVFAGRGTSSVALLFQVSTDLKQGFECRLGQGISLRAMDGKVLWEKPDFIWESGQAYQLEGVVLTDRVRIRVLDQSGRPMIESDECYVSGQNNARKGCLGLRSEGGTVQFTQWTVTPGE
jgi:hypothetical protein